MRKTTLCTLALLVAVAPLAAQPAPSGCEALEYRQFDFWIGEWEVTDAAGQVLGHNTIEPILGGCALRESWRGAGGSVGHSHNIWDRTTGKWHQTWVDNGGTLLQIDGGLEDGAMVMRGAGLAADGTPTLHKITWTPLPDGRVRQHWQVSRDDGASWSDAFVGLYAKVKPVAGSA